MASNLQATKKRKRRHGGSSKEAKGAVAPVAIAPVVEKEGKLRHKKKTRREDTPPPPLLAEPSDNESEGKEKGKKSEDGKNETEDSKGGDNIIGYEDEDEEDRPKHLDTDTEPTTENNSSFPLDALLSLPDTGEHPTKFADLKLSPGTQKAIEKMGFETMTEVQSRTIPPLMAGRDVHICFIRKPSAFC